MAKKTLAGSLAALSVALAAAGCAGGGSGGAVRSSDPHLEGPRNVNYDHLLVPGERIGPARMGGSVREAIQHLGEPDHVTRSTFRGPGYDADEVYYTYNNECLRFTWEDKGFDPQIESGMRGIIASCGKWSTSNGLHVGSPLRDVIARIGEYCATNRKDGTLLIATKEGAWYEAANRNSPVSRIIVVPRMNSWMGMCKD